MRQSSTRRYGEFSGPRLECQRSRSSFGVCSAVECPEGSGYSCDGEGESGDRTDEASLEAAASKLFSFEFVGGSLAARFEELVFGGVEFVAVVVGPSGGGCKFGTLVQCPGVAAEVLPFLGGLGEAAVCLEVFTVVMEPSVEGVPLFEEGLVGDLDVVLIDDDEAGLFSAEGPEYDVEFGVVSFGWVEFAALDTAAGVEYPFSERGEPHEEGTCQCLLLGGEVVVCDLGSATQRPSYTAAFVVCVDGQPRPTPLTP